MATYAELKTRIADDFNRTDISSQIGNEITRAITHFERSRFWFNEEISTASTSSSQQNYGLPSDFLVLDKVELTASSHTFQLYETHWGHFIDAWRDTTSTNGQPSEYSIYQDEIWLGPTPNGVYTLRISYIKSLPALSADADSNAWTLYAEDLVASRAARMIAMRTLRLPPQDVTYFAGLEREAWNALMLENDQRLTTGRMAYNP